MPSYDFTDLQTGEALPDDWTYSAVELVHEHRHRWVLDTHIGPIILQRMPLRLQRICTSARLAAGPSVRALLQELDSLRPFMAGLPPEEIDEDTKERAMEITHQLMLSDLSALAVIVSPELRSLSEYDDLLGMLTTEEREHLLDAVTEMASVRPTSQVDPTPLEVAERLGIHVIPDDMVEHMTVSQAEYFSKRISDERKAIERMRRGRQ